MAGECGTGLLGGLVGGFEDSIQSDADITPTIWFESEARKPVEVSSASVKSPPYARVFLQVA
jgi:hypothetical protein